LSEQRERVYRKNIYRIMISFLLLIPFIAGRSLIESEAIQVEKIIYYSGLSLLVLLIILNSSKKHAVLNGTTLCYYPYSSNRFAVYCQLTQCEKAVITPFYLKLKYPKKIHYLFLRRKGKREILKTWKEIHKT